MKSYAKWVAITYLATSGLALAQTAPTDVPNDHWAYDAVQELANKGLVLGYPDGKFLGNRALTRYEMATIIQRILKKIGDDLDARAKELSDKIDSSARSAQPANPPANETPGVTKEELDEVQKLVDEYKVELTVIGTDLEKAKADIAELQKLKGEVHDLSVKVGGIGEKVTTLDQSVADLKKSVKINGYIQARYQGEGGQFKPGAKADDNFFIRRGRLKFAYDTDKSGFVLQIDGSGDNAVVVKDAYAIWKLSPIYKDRQPIQLWFGQFNFPIGYEIEVSDADSPFLERSLAENALFPGERDRGIKALANLGPKAWIDASILNGGGINQPTKDDNFKDYTLRLKTKPTKRINVGVSGLWGKTVVAGVPGTAATPGTLVYNKDTNGDGVIDQTDAPTFVPGKAAVAAIPAFNADRKRYNVDTQITALGGTILGEYYWGRQPNTIAIPTVKVEGWYAAFFRNISASDILSVRYDTYDPDKDTANDASSRWTAAWHHLVNKNLKLTGQMEWFPTNPKGTESDPRFTFQAQTRF